MSSHRLPRIALLALVASCGPSKQPVKIPDPVTVTPDAATTTDPTPNEHEQAVAEVARLKALADQDPLLKPWTGPYDGVPAWDHATVDKLPPAFTLGLQLLAAEVKVITTNPEPATFENTFVPFEDAGRYENRAEIILSVLSSNMKTAEVQEVELEWFPKLQAAYDAITFDSALFARIEAVYGARESLEADQRRLVELTYDRFVASGAKLTAEEKEKVGAINAELASLFSEFSNRVLADENTWVVLETKADLAGLSASQIASLKTAADERGLEGKWAVVNTRSIVDPFLTTSSRRDLREKVWKAFKNRGDNGDANDTNELITKIVKLRADRAAIMGYPSHAHLRMYDTMAKDPAKADELMMRIWKPTVKRVKEEVAEMLKIAKKDKVKPKVTKIEPWDYLYYAEKVRKKKYDLDQETLKPYFELSNMINAAFYMSGELYGLDYSEITGEVPVWHPDVRVWKVTDRASGDFVGLFYGDYFAREGKRSGAWMSGHRGYETFTGKTMRPIVTNNNNFVKGAPEEPVLISLDDAQTLFHEFGHAIHGLVASYRYPGLGNTPRDFVEYPSQVHEMWVLTRPILDAYGKHYKTGKAMPQALIKKVEAAAKFNQGYEKAEFMMSAILDMRLHTDPSGVVDPKAFEKEQLAAIGAPKEVALRHRLPQFLHLFSGDGYSAGYYSYLWSEVMDADTRLAFQETGNVFDPETARKMKEYILAPGNSTDRSEAYRQFRGRDPDVKALLIKLGFPTDE